MTRTLNRLIREVEDQHVEGGRLSKLIEEIATLHEEAQQTRLVIENKASQRISDALLDIEYGFCELRNELEERLEKRRSGIPVNPVN